MSKRLKRPYVTASNGLEAVQQYGADPTSFMLILMDMSMPVMDGFVATETIRIMERRNKWKPCRIVAVTGLGSEDARRQAEQSGIDELIVKPATVQKLKALIERTSTEN